MKRRALGFTLVEMLVATAMFALLVAAALSVFSAGTRSGAKTRRCKEMVAHGQMALDSMCADLRAAVAHDNATITSLNAQYDGRDCDTMDFAIVRVNPDRKEPDEGGRSEVGYYINNDPNVGTMGLVRREDRTPDDDLLQVDTSGEGSVSHPGDGVWHGHFLEGFAERKGVIADVSHVSPQCHADQVGASGERAGRATDTQGYPPRPGSIAADTTQVAVLDGGHAVGHGDADQSGAVAEAAVPDHGDGLPVDGRGNGDSASASGVTEQA